MFPIHDAFFLFGSYKVFKSVPTRAIFSNFVPTFCQVSNGTTNGLMWQKETHGDAYCVKTLISLQSSGTEAEKVYSRRSQIEREDNVGEGTTISPRTTVNL